MSVGFVWGWFNSFFVKCIETVAALVVIGLIMLHVSHVVGILHVDALLHLGLRSIVAILRESVVISGSRIAFWSQHRLDKEHEQGYSSHCG